MAELRADRCRLRGRPRPRGGRPGPHAGRGQDAGAARARLPGAAGHGGRGAGARARSRRSCRLAPPTRPWWPPSARCAAAGWSCTATTPSSPRTEPASARVLHGDPERTHAGETSRCLSSSTKDRDKLDKDQFAYVDRAGRRAPADPRRVARPQRDQPLQPDRLPERQRQAGSGQEDHAGRQAPWHRGRRGLRRRQGRSLTRSRTRRRAAACPPPYTRRGDLTDCRARLDPNTSGTSPARAAALLLRAARRSASLLPAQHGRARGARLVRSAAPTPSLPDAPDADHHGLQRADRRAIGHGHAARHAAGTSSRGVGPLTVDARGHDGHRPAADLDARDLHGQLPGHLRRGRARDQRDLRLPIDPTGTQAPPIATSTLHLALLGPRRRRWHAGWRWPRSLALTGLVIFWLFSARPALAATGIAEVPGTVGADQRWRGRLAPGPGCVPHPCRSADHRLRRAPGGHGSSSRSTSPPVRLDALRHRHAGGADRRIRSFALAVSRWIAHDEARRRDSHAPLPRIAAGWRSCWRPAS